MAYDPDRHRRRSIRLQGYDYTQAAAYFVTICTYDRGCLFGDIVGAELRLNALGHIVEEEWRRTAEVRGQVALDACVVMPNHVHGIVLLLPPGAGPIPGPMDPRGYRGPFHGVPAAGVHDVLVGTPDASDAPDITVDGMPDTPDTPDIVVVRARDTSGTPDTPDTRDNPVVGAPDTPDTRDNPVVGAQRAAPLPAPLHPVDQHPMNQRPVDKGGRVNVAAGSLGAVVRAFKSAATRRVNQARGTPGASVWQRGYWDRILRDERAWRACRRYIEQNPVRWAEDRHHPGGL